MFHVRSPEDLGRALAELRRAAAQDQTDVAARVGVERSYLAKLEGGHSSPLLDLIFDVLAELDATLTVSRRGEDVVGRDKDIHGG